MTPIIWVTTLAVVFVLVFFIWVVAVSWQNGDKDKFNILEEATQQLSSEDLIDIERSFS